MYDRPYMRNPYSGDQQTKNVLLWLIGINVGIFAIQLLAGGAVERAFALYNDSLTQGMVWTPFTYSFLHGTGGFFHILGNMLGLFFLGRALLPVLGTVRFLQVYVTAAISGGLLWYLVNIAAPMSSVVGASAAVLGLLTIFACLYPDREIQVLLFFILPVKVKPKILAFISLGIAILGMLAFEIAGDPSNSVAHSAHLGGMIGGYLFYRFIYAKTGASTSFPTFKVPKLFGSKKSKPASAGYKYKVNLTKPQDIHAEVDRILDKINSKGFGALTAEEKKILDDARDVLKRR
ncbi:MAG: rhomboid family intramembrane serine protease [Verrucomicrobiota bacterium]